MAKRTLPRKKPRRIRPKPSCEPLRKALSKRKKAELVETLVGLARNDRQILRQLEKQFDVAAPNAELAAATLQAIADATDFDEREINYNFDYDYKAYQTVQRNLKRLVKAGDLTLAMELSLELMSRGSYQVEMSDEGMMTDDVEDCLMVVLQSLAKSNLPPEQVLCWCRDMSKADRIGFMCDRELIALRDKLSK